MSRPAARIGDQATGVGPPDTITAGEPTVLIGGKPAARLGDATAHGGVIVTGCATVLIGSDNRGQGTGRSSALGSGPEKESGLTSEQRNLSPAGTAADDASKAALNSSTNANEHIKPTLDDLLKDSNVVAELKKAWHDSNPYAPEVPKGSPGSLKKEQGGGIYWNKKSGELKIERTRAGTRDGISGAPISIGTDWEKVAEFHTHPNTVGEGYTSDPGRSDKNYVRNVSKVPEIIETHDGRKTISYP